MTIERRPLADRFMEKVDKRGDDECWPWLGAKQPSGYGRIGAGGRRGGVLMAHRVSYELHIGPIPDGLVIDHLCRDRGCVNPRHLQSVTQRVNLLRGEGASAVNARKTRCRRGHPYSGVNNRGDRICHVCAAANARRYKAAR